MPADLRDGQRAQFPRRVKPRPPRPAERRGLNVKKVIGGRQNSALDRQCGSLRITCRSGNHAEGVANQKDFPLIAAAVPRRFGARRRASPPHARLTTKGRASPIPPGRRRDRACRGSIRRAASDTRQQLDAAFGEPLAPGGDIIGADRECEMSRPRPSCPGIVPRHRRRPRRLRRPETPAERCAREISKATRRGEFDKGLEPEQIAIERRGALKVRA